jgi:CIC family chloride channel protein
MTTPDYERLDPSAWARRVLPTAKGPLRLGAIALVVGVGGAVASVVFLWLINLVTALTATAVASIGWPALLGAAAVGGLSVGLMVHWFASEAKGHGVPEVMSAVALKGGKIRPRVVGVKVLASAITIGTGGSAGREGPIVQVGAALGSALGQWFKVSEDHLKTLVGCGAAAGIAATFNAPIGGVFFAMEVILGSWNAPSFGLIALSAISASTLSHALSGDHPALTQLSYSLSSGWELPLYLVLGVVASLGAQLYSKVLYAFEDLFDERLRMSAWVKPALGGILFATLGLFIPATLGRGEDIVHALLGGHLPEQVSSWTFLAPPLILIVLALAKILSTSLTIGSGGSGGIFFPGLYVGAALGGSVGQVAHALAPSLAVSPGAYALVGMGAFFAGMTHAPITAIIMLFEMTRDYRIILPLMLACVVSFALSRLFSAENIYTLKLARQGIRIHSGKEVSTLQSLSVGAVMTRNVDIVQETDRIAQVIEHLQKTNHTGFPVVDSAGRLAGIVTLSDIRRLPLEGRLQRLVRTVMTTPVVAVTPEADLDRVLRTLSHHDIGRVPVLDREDRIVGIVTRSDILRAYNAKVLQQESLA